MFNLRKTNVAKNRSGISDALSWVVRAHSFHSSENNQFSFGEEKTDTTGVFTG